MTQTKEKKADCEVDTKQLGTHQASLLSNKVLWHSANLANAVVLDHPQQVKLQVRMHGISFMLLSYATRNELVWKLASEQTDRQTDSRQEGSQDDRNLAQNRGRFLSSCQACQEVRQHDGMACHPGDDEVHKGTFRSVCVCSPASGATWQDQLPSLQLQAAFPAA